MAENCVLAADLGGTNLRTAIVARDGSVFHQCRAATPQIGEAADIVDAIVDAARSCISAASRQPAAFGVAAAALIDPTGSRVLTAPNLHQLDGVPLATLVSQKLGIQVRLENDATAASIGEHWLGSSKGYTNSICVTLGTGVGGGLILDNRPYRGACGTAGEVGHICVEPDGMTCGCGSRGCLEQYSSATAIVRIAKELGASAPVSEGDSASELTARDVYEAAVSGDACAIETFRIMGRYLGIALADLIDVLSPDVIVIGGGAAGAWDLFIKHVKAEIEHRAFKHPAALVKIVRGELGDTAGILGAARVAFDAADLRAATEHSLS